MLQVDEEGGPGYLLASTATSLLHDHNTLDTGVLQMPGKVGIDYTLRVRLDRTTLQNLDSLCRRHSLDQSSMIRLLIRVASRMDLDLVEVKEKEKPPSTAFERMRAELQAGRPKN